MKFINNKLGTIMVILIIVSLYNFNTVSAERSRYALPAISGTGVIKELSEIGGLSFTVKTITLESNSRSSYLHLNWNETDINIFGENSRFRLSLASQLRSFQYVELTLPNGEIIDSLDLSMGDTFQLYECIFSKEILAKVLNTGIDIRIKGEGGPVSFFIADKDIPDSLCPHLLIPGTLSPREEFYNRFSSRAAYANFGWQGGCVMDGLEALTCISKYKTIYTERLKDLLSLYYPEGGEPKKYRSAENTSCVAQLAINDPDNDEISSVLNFWYKKMNEQGIIADHTIAAEINYTTAWPLAVISKQLNNVELEKIAWDQIRARAEYLVDEDGAIWLRYHMNDQTTLRTYKLWSRGLVWYFLGMAKTMDYLGNPPDDIISEFQRTASYLLALQNDEGMWHMFANDKNSVNESSGTAGIATAIAIGVRNGWLEDEMKSYANKALLALDKRLTPDGFLRNVAQCNRAEGGEEFQRITQGGILQFGMGLYAQLLAEMQK